MNHLAHSLLTIEAGHSLLGSFAGDFLRGPIEELAWGDADVRAGVKFHRRVDAFTDDHAAAGRARARFAPPHRRWAGVLVDVWFDYVLARSWQRYCDVPLDEFTTRVNGELDASRSQWPPAARPFLDYAIRENVLSTYGDRDGIARAFRGMSRRIHRANPLAEAMAVIEPLESALEMDFHDLFPEALAMAQQERQRVSPE